MPGGIDYSKWDNLDEYSDDDNDDGDIREVSGGSRATAAPRVTRLDAPSSVTFGGGTDTIQATTASSSVSPAAAATTAASQNSKVATASSSSSSADPWIEKGGLVVAVTKSNNHRELYWTQDRYSVTLRCELFEAEKTPKTITVEGIVPYSDRHCAMGSSKPRLKVVGSNDDDGDDIVLEGDLPHSVHLANDEEDVDWCIERRADDGKTTKKRFVTITLYKAVPMQGLFVWWKRPLMDFDEITLDQESSAASKEFVQAWEEAHRLFKEKKRNPPVSL